MSERRVQKSPILGMPYNLNACPQCKAVMVPMPVPGAERFPRRLECPTHGYPGEKRNGFSGNAETETETPNDYLSEVASVGDFNGEPNEQNLNY